MLLKMMPALRRVAALTLLVALLFSVLALADSSNTAQAQSTVPSADPPRSSHNGSTEDDEQETGAAKVPTVTTDWSLTPSGLSAGDEFRLIFVTSGRRDAQSGDIGVYNEWVQGFARRNLNLLAFAGRFRVLASSGSVDARDNTGTTYTDSDKGVPIYWLGGEKVADDYEDLYDGTAWDSRNPTDESGSATTHSQVWVGSTTQGTSLAVHHLGTRTVTFGRPAGDYPLHQTGEERGRADTLPLYALSPVIAVAAATGDTTAPLITGAAIVSDAGEDGTYVLGDRIRALVSFSEPVDVSGAPTLALNVGGAARQAAYEGGSGSAALAFSYTVAAGDNDADGVSIDGGTLITLASGAAIEDAAGNDAALTFGAGLAAQSGHKVDTTPPAKPTGLAASVAAEQVTLSWDDPTDSSITGWQYRHRESSGSYPATWSDVPGSGAATTAHTVRGLTTGTEYTFQVRAVDATGPGAASGEVTATPAVDTTAPSAPSAVELLEPPASPGADPTPTIRVTVGETGGTVTLYSDSTCTAAASAATSVVDAGSPYVVDVEASTAQTFGAAVSYHARHTDESGNASGCSSATVSYLYIPVPAEQTVNPDSALIPGGVTAGQSFRLLFFTSTRRNASSGDIADYNAFVQGRAATQDGLSGFSDHFRAVVSTATVDARDNTVTTFVDEEGKRGVPIYWVGGAKVADDYKDFYDGSWDSGAARTEDGVGLARSEWVFTGSNSDGTKYTDRYAGSAVVRLGQVDYNQRQSSLTNPLSANEVQSSTSQVFFGLSPVITVQAPPTFTGGPDLAVDAAENQAAVTTVAAKDADPVDSVTGYEITGGADRDRFEIVAATGVLSFAAAPDFENPTDSDANNTYIVAVTATSGTGDRELTASQTITVTVTNVNEDGAVAFDSDSPQVGTSLTATLSDPDGGVADLTWTWESSADRSAWAAAPGTATSGGLTSAYTPVAGDAGKWLRATASYSDAANTEAADRNTAGAVSAAQVAARPKPTLVLSATEISEDGGSATVTATLAAAASVETTITVSAAAVSPAVAADFTQTGTGLTIAAGATTSAGAVSIAAVDNESYSGDRTITVSGVVSGNAALDDPEDVTLTIEEDEVSCLNTTAAPSGSSTGLVKDCEILLAAKDDLLGATDARALNWSADTAIADWSGVTVSGGRVTGLRLTSRNLGAHLNGTIPADLGSLSALTRLNLSTNHLTGSIPSELGDLTNLTDLLLSNNQFTGSIPTELGDLSNLEILDLSTNALSGGIPTELGALTELTILDLSANGRVEPYGLSGSIPTQLGALTKLTTLRLSTNALTGGIPTGLGALTDLRTLELFENDLSGSIPSALQALTKLETLALRDNALSGALPDELIPANCDTPTTASGLCALDDLDLRENALTATVTVALSPAGKMDEGDDRTVTATVTLDAVTRWANGFSARSHPTTVTLNVAGSGDSGVVAFAATKGTVVVQVPREDAGATGTFTLDTTPNRIDENDETVTVSVDSAKSSAAAAVADLRLSGDAATILIEDDDERGVVLSASSLNVPENGTGLYSLRLNSQPTDTVTVTPARASGGSPDITFSPATLTFTATDWERPQEVTVSAARDADAVDDTATITHSASGGDYAGQSVGSVAVTVDDTYAAPAAPVLTSAVSLPGQVRLYWTHAGDTTISKWQYSSDDGVTWNDIAESASSTRRHDVGGLATGTSYTFKVRACNDYCGSASGARSAAPGALVTVTATGPTTTQNGPFDVTLTFSEPVNVGRYGHFSATNARTLTDADATPVNPTTATDDRQYARTWKVRVTPEKTVSSGTRRGALDTSPYTVSITLPTGVGATFDNRSSVAVGYLSDPDDLPLKVAVDLPPTATMTAKKTSAFGYLVSIYFTEEVGGLASSDFTVTNAKAQAPEQDLTNRVLYTMGVVLTASGDVVISLPANSVTDFDKDGNAGQGNVVAASLTIPNFLPTPTITGPAGPLAFEYTLEDPPAESNLAGKIVVPTSNFTVTITFDRAVSGVSADHLRVANGKASNLMAVGGSSTAYTATITPGLPGITEVTYRAAKVTDAIGNANLASNTYKVIIGTAPEFGAETASRSVEENSRTVGAPVTANDPDEAVIVAGLSYSLGGEDAETFEIDPGSGQIRVKAAAGLDFESAAKKTSTVTVSATDSTKLTDTITVTITLRNVDEAGTVTFSSSVPVVGAALTATLADLDGDLSDVVWTWARSDTRTGAFTDISGASLSSYTPVDSDGGKWLRATASYSDGHGPGKTKSAVAAAAVIAPVNDEPEFASDAVTYSLAENFVPSERAVGAPVTATDPNGDTLTYALMGEDIAGFEIDAATGQIRVKSYLDYEATATHSLTVTVSDGRDILGESDPSADDSITVTVNVVDVDEPAGVYIEPQVPQVGVRLTAVLAGGNGTATATSWAWYRSSDHENWTPITGANSATYTPGADDLDKYLRASATYNDKTYSGRTAQAETYFLANPFVMEISGPREPVTGSFDLHVYFVQAMRYEGNEHIAVTGGTLSGVQAVNPQSSGDADTWRLTITPSSGGAAVQVSASEGAWCLIVDSTCSIRSASFVERVTVSVPAGGD